MEDDGLLADLRLMGLRYLDFEVHVRRLGLMELALESMERSMRGAEG